MTSDKGRVTVSIADSAYQPLRMNRDGQLEFDEATLGILDAHVRRIVRQEVAKIADEYRSGERQ